MLPKPPVDTTRVKNARIIRLKDELNRILEMVTQSREALEITGMTPGREHQARLSADYLKGLRELTVMFRELTTSRIALDKAEKSLEKEMTPAEEKAAVFDFVLAMPGKERGPFLKKLILAHNAAKAGTVAEHQPMADTVEAE